MGLSRDEIITLSTMCVFFASFIALLFFHLFGSRKYYDHYRKVKAEMLRHPNKRLHEFLPDVDKRHTPAAVMRSIEELPDGYRPDNPCFVQ